VPLLIVTLIIISLGLPLLSVASAKADPAPTNHVLLPSVIKAPPNATGPTAYLVDSPSPGSTDHFADFTQAVSYLCSQTQASEQGTLFVQTNRSILLDEFSPSCNLAVQATEGYNPIIQGPGDAPLVFTPSGSLSLTGLTIMNSSAADGLVTSTLIPTSTTPIVFDVTFPLVLQSNNFGTDVIVNVLGETPASSTVFAAASGSQALIDKNLIAGGLQLNIKANVTGDYALKKNQTTSIIVGGAGTIGGSGQLTLDANATSEIKLQTKLAGTAQCKVWNHAGVGSILADFVASDSPTCSFTGNVVSTLKVNSLGTATLTMKYDSNKAGDATLSSSTKDGQMTFLKDAFDSLTLKLQPSNEWLPSLTATLEEVTVNQSMSLEALGLTKDSKCNTTLKGTYVKGSLSASLSCTAHLQLTSNTTIDGAAAVEFKNTISQFDAVEVKFNGGLGLTIAGIQARMLFKTDKSQFGGMGVTIGCEGDVCGQIAITEAFFKEKGLGGIILRKLGVNPPFNQITSVIRPAQSGETIVISNLTDAGYIHITGLQQPVTIENNTLSGDIGNIAVVDQDGVTPLTEAVTIRGNQLEVGSGPGISVASVHGAEVTIEGNTVAGNDAYIMLVADANSQMTAAVNNNAAKGISVMSGSGSKAVVIANENQLSGGTMAVSAVDGGSSVLRLTDNQIDGAKVGVGANGYVSANGNTFSGSEIADEASFLRASGISGSPGGLTNDPVSSNSGLSPDDVSTGIDFDGNGCADYPPELNKRNPDTGKCGLDGVPPVNEPGR
jgi:hypothetical protein